MSDPELKAIHDIESTREEGGSDSAADVDPGGDGDAVQMHDKDCTAPYTPFTPWYLCWYTARGCLKRFDHNDNVWTDWSGQCGPNTWMDWDPKQGKVVPHFGCVCFPFARTRVEVLLLLLAAILAASLFFGPWLAAAARRVWQSAASAGMRAAQGLRGAIATHPQLVR